jgi:hypothetical protein
MSPDDEHAQHAHAPASTGQTMMLNGTGLGAITSDDAEGVTDTPARARRCGSACNRRQWCRRRAVPVARGSMRTGAARCRRLT